LERRVRQDPASIAFGALAEEYRRAGRLEEAVAACRAGLERHPSYLSARVTLGRALQELGQPAEAREEFQYVLSLAPDNLAAIRGLAELHGDDSEESAPPPPAPSTPPPLPEPPEALAADAFFSPAPADDFSGLDLAALDAAIDLSASSEGSVADAERAAQIERLEIWLAKLEHARAEYPAGDDAR
jgi:tetratricopeptide (TPR) repeat protein